MSNVIMRQSESVSHGAHITSSRRSIRMGLDLVPKTIEIATCSVVMPEMIAWVGNPERSNRDVSLQHEEGHN